MKRQFQILGKVLVGDQHGRSVGVPTINLDPSLWPTTLKLGVYVAQVQHGGNTYVGALYYGPRLIKDETNNVLEITLLDFSGDLYGQAVKIVVGEYIRSPIDFPASKIGELQMKQQIAQDIDQIRLLTDSRSDQ